MVTRKEISTAQFILKTPDIRKKIISILALLALYRCLTYVPLPGVDSFSYAALTAQADSPDLVTGFLDLLSGGALSRLSILALGLFPYIAATNVIAAAIPVFPSLQHQAEYDPWRFKDGFNLWSHILVIPFACLQTYFLLFAFSACPLTASSRFGLSTDPLSIITIFSTLTAGAYIVLWITKWIDHIGFEHIPGTKILILCNVIMALGNDLTKFWNQEILKINIPFSNNEYYIENWIVFSLFIIILFASIYFLVHLHNARRNVEVFYPGRRTGNRMSMPVKSKLPLSMQKIIDHIFDSQAFTTLPLIISLLFLCSPDKNWQNFSITIQRILQPDSIWAGLILTVTVFILVPFLSKVQFESMDYADNLKKNGARIPGCHAGNATKIYLSNLNDKLTIITIVMVLPIILLPWILNVLFHLDLFILAGEIIFFIVSFSIDIYYVIHTEKALRNPTPSFI